MSFRSGDGAPLFELCPKTLDPIEVVVDPKRIGDIDFVALRWDRGTGALVPNEVAEGMAGVSVVGHDAGWDDREVRQEQGASGSSCACPGSYARPARGASGRIRATTP